jgi:hypothetical protein
MTKPSQSLLNQQNLHVLGGKGKRGRPITTWRRTIENEIKEKGYTWGTTERKANNREEWRKLVLIICAMRHRKKWDFIYYNIIAIKWGESTHFPGRTGNRGETTRIPFTRLHKCIFFYASWHI